MFTSLDMLNFDETGFYFEVCLAVRTAIKSCSFFFIPPLQFVTINNESKMLTCDVNALELLKSNR